MHKLWLQNKFKPEKKPIEKQTNARSLAHMFAGKVSPSDGFFYASDYAKIYNFPAPQPAVFGIVAFGGGLYGNTTQMPNSSYPTLKFTLDDKSDMFKSWSLYGISTKNFPSVYIVQLGATNSPKQLYTIENTLDVTTIGACCPHSKAIIVVYLAPNTVGGFRAAFNAAISGTKINRYMVKPTVISCSWGGTEMAWPKDDLTGNGINKILSRSTVPICVATGDSGAANGLSSANVNFPASSPYVIACGGTTLVCPLRSYSGEGTSETAWSYSQLLKWGGGGGYSKVYPMPSWQSKLVGSQPALAAAEGKRAIPDVAMNADPATGIQMYNGGRLVQGMGGTSIVSPAMAALIGCMNIPSLTLDKLYKPLTYPPYHDVTSGNIGEGIAATVHYDCCTGIGSMDGKALVTAI